MTSMVCGRCAQKTATDSTYCPRCRWVLVKPAPDHPAMDSSVALEWKMPRGGFLDRRRLDHHRVTLQRALYADLDKRTQEIEKQLSALDETCNDVQVLQLAARLHRNLGEIAYISGNYERAQQHLQHAHQLDAVDLESATNLAVILAQRGQPIAALELLRPLCKAYPHEPVPLLNLALIALQAHRSEAVLEVVAHLESLWRADPGFETRWRDLALTARGLALLQLQRPHEARLALEVAAHQASSIPEASTPTHDAAVEQREAELFSVKVSAADALNTLALAEIGAGNMAAGAAHLHAALQIEPGHARAHNNLGVLAFWQGRSDVALKYFEAARQIEAQIEAPDAGRINNFATLLAARGESEASFEQLAAASEQERAGFAVFYNLGRAYIERGRPEKGVENLRRAFVLDPRHPDPHVVLGAAYLLRGQSGLLSEAIRHLKRALQSNPNHHIAQGNLALTLSYLEQDEAAISLLDQTLTAFPHNVEAQFQAALLEMDKGGETRWAAASDRFAGLYQEHHGLVASLYNAALCQFLMGFREAAGTQLQEVVQRDPSFAPAYYLIGVAHATAKRMDDALTAWKKALEFEPENAELQANMGYIHYKRGQWDRAIRCYMTAHHQAPKDAPILSSLGLSFARAGMFPNAVTALNQSLMIDSRSPATHSNIGLAYYLQQQVEMAIEHWRIVSQLDRSYAERRGDDLQTNFDDEMVAMQPLNWRRRMVRLAPTLPHSHMRLLPGYTADDFELMLSDAEVAGWQARRHEIELSKRHLAGMNLQLK